MKLIGKVTIVGDLAGTVTEVDTIAEPILRGAADNISGPDSVAVSTVPGRTVVDAVTNTDSTATEIL